MIGKLESGFGRPFSHSRFSRVGIVTAKIAVVVIVVLVLVGLVLVVLILILILVPLLLSRTAPMASIPAAGCQPTDRVAFVQGRNPHFPTAN